MKWSEFGNILFTISQIKILSSDFEWRVIVEVFRERMLSNYDQEKIIKGITSLSLAQVKSGDDFWFDVFETIEKNIDAEKLDSFLKMNLLWSMGRNVEYVQPHIMESLTSKTLPRLTKDLEKALIDQKENQLVSFIPNLAWSCRVLHITDEALWSTIDRLIHRLHKKFSLDEIQSIIPSYYEIGRFNTESPSLFKGLEDRFKEIKSDVLTNEKDEEIIERFKERAVIIQSYIEKIHTARASASNQSKGSSFDDIGFQSEDDEVDDKK